MSILLISLISLLEMEIDSGSFSFDFTCSRKGLYLLVVEHPVGALQNFSLEPEPACVTKSMVAPGKTPGTLYYLYFMLDPAPKRYSLSFRAIRRCMWRATLLSDPSPKVLSTTGPDTLILTQKLTREAIIVIMVISKNGLVHSEVIDPAGDMIAKGEGAFFFMPIQTYLNGSYYYWIETFGPTEVLVAAMSPGNTRGN